MFNGELEIPAPLHSSREKLQCGVCLLLHCSEMATPYKTGAVILLALQETDFVS